MATISPTQQAGAVLHFPILITTKQAAKMMALKVETLYLHIESGLIPPSIIYRLGKSKILIDAKGLLDLMRAG